MLRLSLKFYDGSDWIVSTSLSADQLANTLFRANQKPDSIVTMSGTNGRNHFFKMKDVMKFTIIEGEKQGNLKLGNHT